MSFAAEVQTGGRGEWAGNLVRFATRAEAEQYALDLAARWTAVSDIRVVESEEEVNYYIDPATNELVRGHPHLITRYNIVSAYINNQTDAAWTQLVAAVQEHERTAQ